MRTVGEAELEVGNVLEGAEILPQAMTSAVRPLEVGDDEDPGRAAECDAGVADRHIYRWPS